MSGGKKKNAMSDNSAPLPPLQRACDALPHVRGLVYWDWNIPADTVRFSKEWRHILLRPDDDCLDSGSTSGWWPDVHEDDVIPFLDMARDIVEGHTEDYQTLFRVQRADGVWAWLLSRGTVTEHEDGKAARVEGSLMDISFLRRDVKFQHGTAGVGVAGYPAMLENSPDLIVRMDRELSPLFSNPRIARFLSGEHSHAPSPDDAPGTDIDPEQLAFIRENVRKVFAEGVAARKEVTFATAYAHNVTGEYSFWPEFDEQGKVVAALTQFRDLTDQVLAERRARLNEMRLNALYHLTQMDGAPEDEVLGFVLDSLVGLTGSGSGFLFFPQDRDMERGRMVWSQGYYSFLTPEDLPNDRLPADLLRLCAREGGKHLYRTILNGNSLHPVATLFDDRMRIMRHVSVPVLQGDRVVCLAGVCNKKVDYKEDDLQQLEAFVSGAWLILRRHELIRELQRAKAAAEHANKAKDEFLANVSHELRTPLNGILSMLQLLELLPLSEQQRQYVHTASASGVALLRIISDILDFSRIASGKMHLREEPFDLRNTVESSLSLLRQEAEEKGLRFSLYLDEAIPHLLIGDDARIRQIIFNLVGNALKFTEQGEIRVVWKLSSRNADGQVYLHFSVSDTGIGIPPERLDTIFDAFTQIDSSSTRKHSGNGLGLSIVRHLTGLMGGSIAIESLPGGGTAVHCSIRLSEPDEAANGKKRPQTPEEKNAGNALDILVAEDDEVGRFALRSFLQRSGHRVVCVDGGRPALEALMLYPFQCLFTDIQMPDMDGLEVIRRIREGRLKDIAPSAETLAVLQEALPHVSSERLAVPRDLPVVTVSAHAMRGDRERFLEAGTDYYLSKPIIMKEMDEVLKDIAVRLAAG